MDFIDRIREVAGRFEKRVEQRLETEEATKNALVMPFINNVLGYNVFDPTEVVPEFTADIGTKKGEKVDYAILKDGKPIMLFECKRYGAELGKEQASQLNRYFSSVTDDKFGVLTDGVLYRFYSDLDRKNIMDAKPFLEFNMLDFDEALVDELKKFSKESFDLDDILATASQLKYTREIKRILGDELNTPSSNFVRHFASQLYPGQVRQPVLERFTNITRSAFQQFIRDRVSARLKSALAEEQKPQGPQFASDQSEEQIAEDTGIVTTEEEIEGYHIVKSILRDPVGAKRVAMRDHKSYCSILLDDKATKPLCRLYFNSPRKYLGLFDDHKKVEKVPISELDDIYNHSDRIRGTAGLYGDTPAGVTS